MSKCYLCPYIKSVSSCNDCDDPYGSPSRLARHPDTPAAVAWASPPDLQRIPADDVTRNAPNPKQAMGDRKVKLALVPSAATIYAAQALQYGAFHSPRADGQPPGYGPYSWRETKVEAMTYAHAALRHLYEWIDGLDRAHDSNAPTLGHAMACLAILADATETGNLIDNRPKTGAAPRLLW